MKRIKKIASLLLAMVMVFAMSVTAFATNATTDANVNQDSYTITMTGKASGHSYKAYQVFAGELAKSGTELKLSNIIWGADVDGDALLTALQKVDAFKDAKNARDVAEVLGKEINNKDLAESFADIVNANLKETATGQAFTEKDTSENESPVYEATVTAAGYYFIKDETENMPEGESYTDFILEVVGDTQTATKDDTVKVEKEIIDGDQEVTSNKAGIGDDVTYVLKSNVPEHSAYDYYFFVMNDTLSTGLTFNNDVVVTVGDQVLTRGVDYGIYDEHDELVEEGAVLSTAMFRIAFVNIKDYEEDAAIRVTYSAEINADAVIGEEGNTNEVNLTYSNNPNESGQGKNKDGKPGIPDTDENPPVGETNKIKVVTFVTQIEIFKTQNGTTQPLSGAEFTLTGFSTQTVLKGGKQYVPAADGTHYQLKDGSYTTTAPQTEATIKDAANGAKAGYVVAEADYNETDVRVVGGTAYRPYKEGDQGKIYVIVEPNDDKYASVTAKFKEVEVNENTKTTKYVTMTATSDENGKIVFNGLGEGEFLITETKTPDGFNTAAPIKVVITGTVEGGPNGVISGNEKCIWTTTGSTDGVIVRPIEGDKRDSVEDQYYVNIVNNTGSLLPSTGGIGTTIFYVVGGILVIGAGILLVTKRRMKAQ